MMSMPERSNGQVSSAVEKRLEEGDHALTAEGRVGGRLATSVLGGIDAVDRTVHSSRERAVHLFIGQYLRSSIQGVWVQISCQSCTGHSVGKVNVASAEGKRKGSPVSAGHGAAQQSSHLQ